MPSLADVQKDFGAMLLSGETPHVPTVSETPHDRVQAGLVIYRNNVMSSLTDALRTTYPVIEKLVGEAFFKAAAAHYIRTYPTSHPVMTFYGEHFAHFLKDFAPAQGLSYLPDVARLEYAWLQSYHAPSVDRLDVMQVQTLPPETLAEVRFHLHPSVFVIDSPYPLYRIWRANTDDAEQDQTISLDDPGESVLIARPSLKVTVRAISSPLFAFLHYLQQGGTLAAAFEAALAVDSAFDLQAALQMCLTEHLLTKIILPKESGT